MEARQVENTEAEPSTQQSGRNIVICLDGTNNQFGEVNTNVVRLVQALDRTPGRQRLYYDPGVGTLAEPGAFGLVRKWISKVAGLAFGAGLDWKAQEAYTYLMDFWEPGDRVFIFGFSRGAYTARVLAGMLYAIGLLPRGGYNMVPYAMRLYREVRRRRSQGTTADDWKKLCGEFRHTFARQVSAEDKGRNFPVYFLGVWDTVSSVGWVWDPVKFPYTARNPGVQIIRHAISIDERRWFFRPNQMKSADPASLLHKVDPQDLDELWFAGVHCDVGGGYEPKLQEEFAELWREPFGWMLGQARKAGLLLDETRLLEVLGATPGAPRPWGDVAHESLTLPWWLAEFFPKKVWDSVAQKERWLMGLGRCRAIPDGAWLDRSVLHRLRQKALCYAPRNITPRFQEEVQGLNVVPERKAYYP